MMRLFATIGTVAALMAGSAYAQGLDADMMGESLSQLNDSVGQEFARLGIDQPVETLTLDQLSRLQLIFSDDGLSEDEKVQQVETIVGETTATQ